MILTISCESSQARRWQKNGRLLRRQSQDRNESQKKTSSDKRFPLTQTSFCERIPLQTQVMKQLLGDQVKTVANSLVVTGL